MAFTPLLVSVPYLSHSTIDDLTASQPSDNYILSPGSPDRPSESPENDANIEVAQITESPVADLFGLPLSLRLIDSQVLRISCPFALGSARTDIWISAILGACNVDSLVFPSG